MTNNLPNRYYQLVLIWMRDPETFGRYLAEVAPVVERYGGALERMLAPEDVAGSGIERPDIVNIVHYDSRNAFQELEADPAFQAVVPLRSRSIDMLSVEGVATAGTVGDDHGLADRRYLVELARYGRGGEDAYRDYERESATFMASYGYHVERVIAPDTTSPGLPFRPDLVKVAYLTDAGAMARMHESPDHSRIENELYPAAVAESLWVMANVHPATLPAAA